MKLFKAYDVRGTTPDPLNAEVAYGIGRATAHFIGADTLVVGRDARRSSPELCASLLRGIHDEGVSVIDLGLVSTPMVYCAVDQLGAGGGIMVTASHNPAEYNGFKICREHAIPIGEDSGLREIEALVPERQDAPRVSGNPTRESADIRERYAAQALSMGERAAEAKLRVAIDCGNGMASAGLEPVLAQLPIEVERLYFEPDGTFPNHEADPLKVENLADVSAEVRRTGADFGVAFDGDADRAVFVDEAGKPISSDLVTALLARRVLRRNPGGLVLYDLRSSRVVAEEIEAAGGVAAMSRVGHSFVKAQMRETGAVFGGELSGHFYFRFSPTLIADDAVAAFVALLDVLVEEKQPLSKLVDPLRRYSCSGEINRRVEDIDVVLEQIERESAGAPDILHLDGLRVGYEDWWFNLRPSNTEPVLRLNLEADTEAKMTQERDRLLARVEEIGGTAST